MMSLPVVLRIFNLVQAPAGSANVDAIQRTLENLESAWNAAHVPGDAA